MVEEGEKEYQHPGTVRIERRPGNITRCQFASWTEHLLSALQPLKFCHAHCPTLAAAVFSFVCSHVLKLWIPTERLGYGR